MSIEKAWPPCIQRGIAAGNRVVQKLQFLNNNRLKTTKNADFAKKPAFFGRLEANLWLADNQPGYRTSPIFQDGNDAEIFYRGFYPARAGRDGFFSWLGSA
ncbi:MAG: hypothetical protein LBP20_01230 [Treponema sp.]|nr:hypothetical protein [Treponema sp.]